jgi:predicted MFS family arabinose efflux permease
VCVGGSQSAAVALQTLWIATWLRDVAGWNPAEVARGLLAVNVAMFVGYLAFGRAADAWQRRGRDVLPLLAAGVALSSLSLGAIILGAHSVVLWCVFVFGGTAVVPRLLDPCAPLSQGDGGAL